ncbi:MAG: hypothetical protein CMP59_03970 [Flavobacteriales bacterium]|nr:hypothetical protein [Flavobacteriales bacterium]
MAKISWKSLVPYLTAVLLFVAIAVVYFYPVLQGYRIKSTDIKQHKGMSQEVRAHKEKFDEEPLWIGNMFAGMPAYQVSTVRYNGNILDFIHQLMTLGFPYPIGLLFLYLIGFYILLLALKIDPWLAIIGAIAFAFSSYFIIIVEAGHTSKAFAIAYMPPLLGGIISILRGRLWIGALLTAVFMGMELYANHLQITYYLIFVIAIVGIVEMIAQLRAGQAPTFFKRAAIVVVAVIIGVLPNLGNILLTYEYSKHSTRSLSELTIQPDGSSNEDIKSTGLDKDYITRWSYGMQESFSLMIPNVKGGASGAIIADQEEVDRLRREDPAFFNFMVEQYQKDRYVVNTYWGNQPFTSGPVYLGIVICFLAFLSFFFIKDPLVTGLGLAALLALLLAWGKNLMPFSEFFIDYFPMYNKFRAVSMILVLVELVVPILAILFLAKLYQDRQILAANRKRFFIVSGAFVGLLLLFLMLPDMFFDFLSEKDKAQLNKLIQTQPAQSNLIYANFEKIESLRIDAFRSDVLGVLKYLVLAIGLILLYTYDKLKRSYMALGIGALVLVDLWVVDKGFINNEETPGASRTAVNRFLKYEKVDQQKAPHQADRVDYAILQTEMQNNPEIKQEINREEAKLKEVNRRPDLGELEKVRFNVLMRNTHYRVLNTTQKMDEDAKTAYFHKTLGGYHGAKMKKYQELIDFELGIEHYQLRQAFAQGGERMVKQMLPQMNVTNMLNAKYIIGLEKAGDKPVQTLVRNDNALGNAWFVKSHQFVSNADEEIMALQNLDARQEAVVREEYRYQIQGVGSAGGFIRLESYLPNELVYSYQSTGDQLAVFSEIYYDKGWNAYINGQKVPHIKVNYILRGMKVPAGEGEIVFKFEPGTYAIGKASTWIGSILILLIIAGVFYKKYTAKEQA